MTWTELKTWAETNEMEAVVEDRFWADGQYCWAYLVISEKPWNQAYVVEAGGRSPRGAKRVLCNAVKKLRLAMRGWR